MGWYLPPLPRPTLFDTRRLVQARRPRTRRAIESVRGSWQRRSHRLLQGHLPGEELVGILKVRDACRVGALQRRDILGVDSNQRLIERYLVVGGFDASSQIAHRRLIR
jgi:hypothetical protein